MVKVIETHKSEIFQNYINLERNKKKHPINYINYIENILGAELKFYQKLLLMRFIYFKTKEERQLKEFGKILNKYVNN